MKIVFLISSFQAGGAERVGSWLVARLAGAGYDVVAATLSGKDFFYALDPRVRTVKLGLVRPSRGPIDALLASRRRVAAVERLVRDVAPDLLLSFMTAPNLIAIRAGRRAGVPVIVAERNCRGAAIVSVFQDLFRRFLYPRASAVVLQTEADAANYAFLHEASVIPNPVAAPSAAARPRKRIILAVGRLERQKGFDLLLEAFALVEDRRDWRLLIAGEGAERPALEAQIERLGLSGSVELLGRRRDIAELYAEASIFCLSSRYEGFPNVLVEAMAAGCAVISVDCPTGPKEILEDGLDGLLITSEDTMALAAALERLMGDEALRKRLGASASGVRSRFHEDRIFERWQELVSSVTGD